MATALQEAGFEAVHVRDIGLQAAADSEIFARATTEQRIIVSADTDFGTLLASWAFSEPSVILFRGELSRRPKAQVEVLLANLPDIRPALMEGSIVVIEPSRIRIRKLPIWG